MNLPIHLLNTQIFTNGNMSGTITSSIVEVKDAVRLCFQAIWSGTSPIGTLQVEGSNDGITFSPDPEVSASSVSGNTGNLIIKINNPSYAYTQLKYTFTSGTGSLNASLNAKRG